MRNVSKEEFYGALVKEEKKGRDIMPKIVTAWQLWSDTYGKVFGKSIPDPKGYRGSTYYLA